MIITIKANNKYHPFNYPLSGDIEEDLTHLCDYVYSVIFDKSDEIFIWAINHNEYYELNKMITTYMEEDMEKSPMWFSRILLFAMLNAKYNYLYNGYDFDDYNFEEFKESRGLE